MITSTKIIFACRDRLRKREGLIDISRAGDPSFPDIQINVYYITDHAKKFSVPKQN